MSQTFCLRCGVVSKNSEDIEHIELAAERNFWGSKSASKSPKSFFLRCNLHQLIKTLTIQIRESGSFNCE